MTVNFKCGECNATIPSKSDTCPACGYVFQGPKCITCGSRAVEKISLGNKAVAAGLFGVLSLGHLSKTFKCWECGYKW